MTSLLPSRPRRTISCVPQLQNHRWSWCQRGDSPNARPVSRMRGPGTAPPRLGRPAGRRRNGRDRSRLVSGCPRRGDRQLRHRSGNSPAQTAAPARSGGRREARPAPPPAGPAPPPAGTRPGRTGPRGRPRPGSAPPASAPKSQTDPNTALASGRWCRAPAGHHLRRDVVQEVGHLIELGAIAAPLRGRRTRLDQPVLAHHAPGVSPGAGIIAFTSTTARSGALAATSGAVNPPSDCATRTTSSRLPIALRTRSVYSGSPAASSSPGRSTAVGWCPACCSSGTTRCQYQAAPPAPGIRTKPLICHPSRRRRVRRLEAPEQLARPVIPI